MDLAIMDEIQAIQVMVNKVGEKEEVVANSISRIVISLKCQLCGNYNHIACHCYHGFDQHCPNLHQTTTNYPPPFVSFRNSVAYLANPATFTSPSWCLNSKASNHLMCDPSNLMITVNYSDQYRMIIGNGQDMTTRYVEHSLLHSSISNTFHLNNLLHVPSLVKNLLSISQFVVDNQVVFNFILMYVVLNFRLLRRYLL